jgi:hypothetical protein
MATIHPPANGHSYNAEELAANTWSGPKRGDALTPAQLDELRAKAQPTDSHNARAAVDIEDRQARQKAVDDTTRATLAAAEAAKGSALSREERNAILVR